MTGGVLFQHQTEALEKRITVLEKAGQNLERDRDRLGALLRDEKAAHQETGKRADQAEAENAQLRVQVQRGKEIAGRLAAAEQHAADEEKTAANLLQAFEDASAKLKQTEHAHAQAVADYRGTKVERDRLREEIGPFRRLIQLLKDKERTSAELGLELGRLDD